MDVMGSADKKPPTQMVRGFGIKTIVCLVAAR